MTDTDITSLQSELNQFVGTTHYYRFSPIFKTLLLTDGTKYLAEKTGAYWLFDIVGSYLPKVKTHFAIVHLKKNKDGGASFRIVDDLPANKVFARQEIPYTDFPFDKFHFYLGQSGSNYIAYLPSEH